MLCVSAPMTVKFIRPADVLAAKHLEEKEAFLYKIPTHTLLRALGENSDLTFLFGCHLVRSLS